MTFKPDRNPWLDLVGGAEVRKGRLWGGWFSCHPEVEVVVGELGLCRTEDQAVWELGWLLTLLLLFG